MRVLVVGGTNFIGPHVVWRLAKKGHEVTVFHWGQTETGLPEGVKHIRGDRRRLADYADEFGWFAPKVVLDMIAMNEREARDVVSAFGGIARRVVAISSGDVYRAYDVVRRRETGPPDPVPLGEDASLRERLYPHKEEGVEEYEKILVESVVMKDPELPGTVLRLPAVYGPGDYQHRLFPYLKRMDEGRAGILLQEGMVSWRWTHGYVEDVAAAIALAVVDERAAGRIYNVGEPAPLTWAEWVREIGRVAGWNGEIVPMPKDRLPKHLGQDLDTDQHLFVDTSRIRRELGYEEVVSRSEALRDTVAWELGHPPAEVDPASFDYAAEDAALASLDRQPVRSTRADRHGRKTREERGPISPAPLGKRRLSVPSLRAGRSGCRVDRQVELVGLAVGAHEVAGVDLTQRNLDGRESISEQPLCFLACRLRGHAERE